MRNATRSLEPGAAWRCGDRRYVVESTTADAVFLSCLEPPLPPVEGYKGGASREARVFASSLRLGRGGWRPGH